MYVVIPYKLDDGIQLKYTLRSIYEYWQGAEVILSGDAPEWYKGTFIPREVGKSYPAQLDSTINIVRALDLVPDDTCIITSDDTITLRELDQYQDFVDRYEDTLYQMSRKKPANKHLYDSTKSFLERYKKMTYAYTLHTPYRVHVAQYLDIVEGIVLPELLKGHKLLPHSIYANFTYKLHSRGEDMKIYEKDAFGWVMGADMKNKRFVSLLYSDGMAIDYIKKRFKRKSKWEK